MGEHCTGTDCPGCRAAKAHYLATGCLDASCPRDHGKPAADPDAALRAGLAGWGVEG